MQPETESISCDLISYFCLISPGGSAETLASSREARMNMISGFKFSETFLCLILILIDTLTACESEVMCDY